MEDAKHLRIAAKAKVTYNSRKLAQLTDISSKYEIRGQLEMFESRLKAYKKVQSEVQRLAGKHQDSEVQSSNAYLNEMIKPMYVAQELLQRRIKSEAAEAVFKDTYYVSSSLERSHAERPRMGPTVSKGDHTQFRRFWGTQEEDAPKEEAPVEEAPQETAAKPEAGPVAAPVPAEPVVEVSAPAPEEPSAPHPHPQHRVTPQPHPQHRVTPQPHPQHLLRLTRYSEHNEMVHDKEFGTKTFTAHERGEIQGATNDTCVSASRQVQAHPHRLNAETVHDETIGTMTFTAIERGDIQGAMEHTNVSASRQAQTLRHRLQMYGHKYTVRFLPGSASYMKRRTIGVLTDVQGKTTVTAPSSSRCLGSSNTHRCVYMRRHTFKGGT